MKDILRLIILFVPPPIGIGAYLFLVRKIKNERISKPPIKELFIIFATYGTLLIISLISINNDWSGAASLGAFYLLIAAPILLFSIAYLRFRDRKLSVYHWWTFWASVAYFIVFPLIWIILLALDHK